MDAPNLIHFDREIIKVLENVFPVDNKTLPKSNFCRLCNLELVNETMKEHRESFRHIEAQKYFVEELKCDICEENFPKGYWKEHKTSKTHLRATQLNQNKKINFNKKSQSDKYIFQIAESTIVDPKTEIYTVYQSLEQNQQYNITLATFLALKLIFQKRDAFHIRNSASPDFKHLSKHFMISLNNIRWKEFGDIVFEFKNKKIVAIQCRKIESTMLQDISAFSAFSRKFSIREQCEFLKELEENADEDVNFKVFTVSKLILNSLPKIVFDDKIFSSWRKQEEGKAKSENEIINEKKARIEKEAKKGNAKSEEEMKKINEKIEKEIKERNIKIEKEIKERNAKIEKEIEFWRGKSVEIKQLNQYKDIFNTTEDNDDIYYVNLEVEEKAEDLKKKLEHFFMYFNQKTRKDLEDAMLTMIKDKFDFGVELVQELIKYMNKFFRIENVHIHASNKKKKNRRFTLTKEDIVLKIAELLLTKYLVENFETPLQEKNCDLWFEAVSKFDVTFVNANISKIFGGILHILKKETDYRFDYSNGILVNKENVKNPRLKERICHDFTNDRSWKFMHFALWKTGLAPLVLKADTEIEIKEILQVIDFLKSENLFLSFVLITEYEEFGSLFEYFTTFSEWRDLKIVDNYLFNRILEEEVNFLNFPTLKLREIFDCNEDFLEKWTPDDLLNVVSGDFSFKDEQVEMTKDVADNTFALKQNSMDKIKKYFQDKSKKLQSSEFLSYLVNVNGELKYLEIPPNL